MQRTISLLFLCTFALACPDETPPSNGESDASAHDAVVHADATEADDALPDPSTVNCILNAIKKLVFPQPSGGRVFISYPLKLEAPKPAAP